MSDIVEKTITALPGLISGTFSGKKSNSSSRGFQNFVKSLGNLRSRYEEDVFIKRELAVQKQRLGQPGLSTGQTRESLVRLVYCSMLGHDVSFAYIHAIKLAQQGSLTDKRAGYLVSAMFLKDSDELVMLLVNTIQKDLSTTNVACVCMALTAATHLISQEMIPALLPLIEEKLKHPREMVRKKAVLCMLAFYGKAPDLLTHSHHHLGAALCDPDPGVMWAALHYYHQLVKVDPSPYLSLVPTLLSLLQQVLDRRLSSDFEYHGVPAPWLQILLLKTLAKLGEQNESSSQQMYPLLIDLLQRTEPSHKIGLAVIYEGLATILTIHPHPNMVEHAAKVVGRFLSSKNNNLRYLGVKALTLVVRINPGYAMEHQEAVVDCLEHCDLTIRTRTLDLLYQMANPKNRHVISEKLLHHLSTASDAPARAAIVSKVLMLANRFADDKRWYIETVNRAALLGGEASLPSGICEKIMEVLPQRGNDSEESRAVQKFAVQNSWTMLHQDGVPCDILRVSSWILGEFGGIVGELDLTHVVSQLITIFLRPDLTDRCRATILSALIKLSCDVQISEENLGRLAKTIVPQQTELKQRFLELQRISELPADEQSLKTLKGVLEEVNEEHDWCLSFLDNYVAERLENGVQPYKPTYIRLPQPAKAKPVQGSFFAGLNFTPYETSRVGESKVPSSGFGERKSGSGSNSFSHITDSTLTNLQLSTVKRVWTREGVVEQSEKVESPSPKEISSPPSTAPIEEPHKDEQEAGDDSAQDAQVEYRRQQMAQLFSGISDT